MGAPEMRGLPCKRPEMTCQGGKNDAVLHQMKLDCRCAVCAVVLQTSLNAIAFYIKSMYKEFLVVFSPRTFFLSFILCASTLVFAQGLENSAKVSVAEDCLPKLKIPELSTAKENGYSLYVGLWPKEMLCQALLVKSVSKEGKNSAVYSYYGEKEKPSFTALSGVVV